MEILLPKDPAKYEAVAKRMDEQLDFDPSLMKGSEEDK
jgi:hypothetical protein